MVIGRGQGAGCFFWFGGTSKTRPLFGGWVCGLLDLLFVKLLHLRGVRLLVVIFVSLESGSPQKKRPLGLSFLPVEDRCSRSGEGLREGFLVCGQQRVLDGVPPL